MDVMITSVGPLLLVALLTEAFTEQFKKMLPNADEGVKQLISMGFGVFFAVVLQVSLFAQATGGAFVVGIILAGILCSRGSNYVHDFMGMIAAAKSNIEHKE